MKLQIFGFKIARAVRLTGYQGSWMLSLQLGPGAGYRWIDLPGYSSNAAHRIRVRLYIAGRTWSIGRKVVDRRGGASRILLWFSTPGFTRRANLGVYPQW